MLPARSWIEQIVSKIRKCTVIEVGRERCRREGARVRRVPACSIAACWASSDLLKRGSGARKEGRPSLLHGACSSLVSDLGEEGGERRAHKGSWFARSLVLMPAPLEMRRRPTWSNASAGAGAGQLRGGERRRRDSRRRDPSKQRSACATSQFVPTVGERRHKNAQRS